MRLPIPESGLDHYEIRVGESSWSGPVTSPYQFIWVPDGEQTVEVKAVDRAGNITVGTVVIYIDTTPPDPVYYCPIPGNGKIELRWGANQSPDIVRYEIIRTPAFTNGVVTLEVGEISVIHDTLGDIFVFTDSTVEPGGTYSYWLVAIDRAGNRSSPLPPNHPDKQKSSKVSTLILR